MKARFGWLLMTAALVCAQVPAQRAVAPRRSPAAEVPSYRALKFAPLRPVQIPQVSTFTLPNGMKLYLLEHHELPLVSGFALVRAGNLFDPPGKTGVAELAAIVLRTGGTKDLTGDQIDEKLENVAASVESLAGESTWQVSVTALRADADQALAIFRDLLVAPEFRQDKIDLAKTHMRGLIARRNDDPDSIAGREFSDIIYGPDTPYGARLEYEHLNRITRQDLLAFHRRYVFPGNVMLALYGDFSAPEMKTRIEKLFGSWNAQQPPVPRFPEVRGSPQPGIFLAAKPDLDRTFLRVGHLGGVFRDKDYPALEVMAQILGGDFSSRLVKRIRTRLGQAYSIGASWDAGFEQPGLFEISTSTQSLNTIETIQTIREEIDKIRTSPVTGQELDLAKDTVANSFVFHFDTPSKTLLRLVRYQYYGYPGDFIFQYQKSVAAVTKDDILRVANQYLKPGKLTIVAVGNPASFGRSLTETGLPVKNIDLKIPEPKQELAPADAASLRQGRELLARVHQALGGADQLAAIHDFTEVVEMDTAAGSGRMKVKQTNRWIAPSHFHQESIFPFGRLVVYFDGAEGWLSAPQGTQPLAGAILKQAQGQAFRSLITLLLSDRDPLRKVNLADDNLIEISDQRGNVARLLVDQKTALPAKLSYQIAQGAGPASFAAEVFSDWKPVGEIRLPHHITIQQDGRPATEVTVLDWLCNSGLNPEVLSKRP
jgi:zinc protease